MTPFTTDIAERQTLTVMVNTYQLATEEVKTAYQMLEDAQNKLRTAFVDTRGYNFPCNDRNMTEVGEKASTQINKKIHRDAWNAVVNRMELKKLLSIKRREELEKQLSEGELPELTEDNIRAMFENSAANLQNYLEEAVLEVFEYLRPHGSKLKTNTEFEIRNKVILTWMVEQGYGKTPFRVNYHRDKHMIALENVFLMLDGKGIVKSYHGELYDSICSSEDGTGKTPYFKFRCCLNGNLHLEFLRPDLVTKLNKIAGGNRLRN